VFWQRSRRNLVRNLLFARTCLTISRWTKLTQQKGPDYDKVIQILKNADFPAFAEKYANLEKELVDHKVKALLTAAGIESHPRSAQS
jgi:hypothetical protein